MSTTPRSVIVLGANGRFGQAAVAAFAAAGWTVLAQARRAPTTPLPPRVRHLDVAVHDTDALVAAAAGAEVVVHALNPIYTRWPRDLLPLTEHGLALARRLQAHFMLPGNVYNFGEQMPALLRPDTPQRPTTVKGRLRCEVESRLRAFAAAGGRATMIRAGDFFGAGSGTWLDMVMLKSLAKGKLVYPGPLDVTHAWAYLPDLARAFVAVAQRDDDAAGFADLHFAGHSLSGRQLLAAIERAATANGLVPPRGFRHGALPWGLIRAGALVLPMWRAMVEMSYLWRVPHALDGGALAAAVGPLPTTALDDALRQTLRRLGFGAADRARLATT